MNKTSSFQKNVSWAGKNSDNSPELNVSPFKEDEINGEKDERLNKDVTDYKQNQNNTESEIKNELINKKVFGLFKLLLEIAKNETEELNLSTGKRNLFDEIIINKRGPTESEVLINFIEELLDKIIKRKNATILKLETRNQGNSGNYDELLHRLEEEVKESIKKEGKLKLYIDTSKMRINDLEKLCFEQEKSIQQLINDKKIIERELKTNKIQHSSDYDALQKEIEYLNEKLRKNEAMASEKKNDPGSVEPRKSKLLSPNTDTKYLTRPRTDTLRSTASETGFPRKNVQNLFVEKEYQEIYNDVVGAGADLTQSKDNLKLLNQLLNNKKKAEFDNQKYNYRISKMKIQVEQKSRDLVRMDRNYNDLKKDVIKTKEIMYDQEKKRWAKEINSDKNPNFADHFNKEISIREKRIQDLEKKNKKFAIFEKKLLVKERAFEIERSAYHDKLHFLQDRIQNLTNYIENNKNLNVKN